MRGIPASALHGLRCCGGVCGGAWGFKLSRIDYGSVALLFNEDKFDLVRSHRRFDGAFDSERLAFVGQFPAILAGYGSLGAIRCFEFAGGL